MQQENLFKVAGLPMVENCMGGYNSCMFAYGQVSFSVILIIFFTVKDVVVLYYGILADKVKNFLLHFGNCHCLVSPKVGKRK